MNAPVAVYDSGVGGLSVLRALRAALPHERFVYFADDAWAPYGERALAWIESRAVEVAAELIGTHAAKALVVACNTATAAGIHAMRARWPALPIVGVEPALRPALAATRTGAVAVLATRGTLGSAKFAALRQAVEADALAQPRSRGATALRIVTRACDGLAAAIESGDAAAVDTSLDRHLSACGRFGGDADAIDTIVLGCTHYPLVADRIAAWLRTSVATPSSASRRAAANGSESGGVMLLDAGEPVARQLRRRLIEGGLSAPPEQADRALAPRVRFLASRDVARLEAAAARWPATASIATSDARR